MMNEMGHYDSRRPCRVYNSEMTKTENGYFHLWFIPQDGWPKALVELDGAVFKALEKNREKWATNDCYIFPGAIQYFGPSEVCDITTITLQLEQNNVLARV